LDSVASLPKHGSISPQRRGGRGENLEKTLRPLRLGGELTKRRWACYSLEILCVSVAKNKESDIGKLDASIGSMGASSF
jgi:hypothetical protein